MYSSSWINKHFPILLVLLLYSVSLPGIGHAARGEKVSGENGIVVTDETTCSVIGRDVLRRGGHAVDAAVAATLCLGVKNPMDTGLGGGGFMLVRSNGNATVFDMRETAPGRAYKGMYGKDPSQHRSGAMSVAVPGQLAGLYTAHKQYGKLPWGELVMPARHLAHKGFTVSESLYQKLVKRKSHIISDRELRRTFAPNGVLISKGNVLRLEKLADTLGWISKYGMDIFYNGYVGQMIANDIKSAGGILTIRDLKDYKVKIRKPLVAHAWRHEIVTVPPPASGGAVMIMIMKILSHYHRKGTPPSLLIHRAVEALKIALAVRMDLGDPEFFKIDNALNRMISTSYAKNMTNHIKDNQTLGSPSYMNKWSQKHDQGTSHVIVVDSSRNVVTMTTSINTHNGSQYMSPSTGIYLNNHMYDFSTPSSNRFPPAPANLIKPFKRPLSSMAPTILLQGRQVKAVIGAAGGIYIPDAAVQVLMNHFRLNKSILDSVMAPRFYHTLEPNVLYYEKYRRRGDNYMYSPRILDELRKKGHVLQEVTKVWSVCHFVIQRLKADKGRKSGLLVGVSDPRKGGFPAAY